MSTLPNAEGPDPLAHVPQIPVLPTIFMVLFCLFIILFIRVTHFTLSKNNEYAITQGHRQEQPEARRSTGPVREMSTSLTYVGFNTVSSPRSSLYIPNLIFGNNTHGRRTSAPLLVRRESLPEREPVELDSVSIDTTEDWEDNLSMHGTNNLNTPWSWTT